MVDADTTTPPDVKICPICGETKPLTAFLPQRRPCKRCFWTSPAYKAGQARFSRSTKGRIVQRRQMASAYRQAFEASPQRRAYRKTYIRAYLQRPEVKARAAFYKKPPPPRPEVISAHKAVYYAVRNGRLVRPDICSRCGIDPGLTPSGRTRIAGHHHRGYAKEFRLDVVWLCVQCHEDAHHLAN